MTYWRRRQKTRGAMVVELAVMTPLFVIFAFGIIELGRGMMVNNLVAHAASEGVRMAAIEGTTNDEVTFAVQSYMNSAMGLAPDNVSVFITTEAVGGNPDPKHVISDCLAGDLITVKVQVPFSEVALIKGKYLTRKQLTGHSTAPRE